MHKLHCCFRLYSRTSPILVAEIGEPPDISQADGVSQATKEEVELSGPVAALLVLVLEALHVEHRYGDWAIHKRCKRV